MQVVKFPGVQFMSAFEDFDRASSAFDAALRSCVAMYLDACTVAGITRTKEGCKFVKENFKYDETILDAIAMGTLQQSTVNNYTTGLSRAFEHRMEWSPRAHLDVSKGGLPENTWGKKAAARKAGSVRTTDAAALIKTLEKAKEQAHTLKNDVLAAGILDLIFEVKPDYTESAE